MERDQWLARRDQWWVPFRERLSSSLAASDLTALL
jgi:hypothetical protein